MKIKDAPESFRIIEPKKTCADCTHQKFKYSAKGHFCTKHKFKLPGIHSSTELENYTCDDFKEWIL